MYFATYSNGRYITKLAENEVYIKPDGFDFRIVEEFDNFDDAEQFCRSMNIVLRGNYEEDLEVERWQ